MDGITLLIFHIIVIAVIIVTTASIAYNAGKKTGYLSMSRKMQVKEKK